MKPTALQKALLHFQNGPAVLGVVNPKNSINLWKHLKSTLVDGKRYPVIWVSTRVNQQIEARSLLESVTGGTVYRLTENGKQELSGVSKQK